MSAETKLPPLTGPQAQLIAAAIRYRTLDVPPIASILKASSEEALDKMVKRLTDNGWLHQLKLPGRKGCYVLSRQAVRELGLSKKAMKQMGQAAVISNLAILWFCAQKQVERLTRDEIREALPDLDSPGLQVGNYFTDTSTDPHRLTWIMVDRGSPAAVLIRKVGRIVRKSYQFSSLMQLAQAGQFAIVILVPNERKKWLVERVLTKHYVPHATIWVHVVSDLEPLLLS